MNLRCRRTLGSGNTNRPHNCFCRLFSSVPKGKPPRTARRREVGPRDGLGMLLTLMRLLLLLLLLPLMSLLKRLLLMLVQLLFQPALGNPFPPVLPIDPPESGHAGRRR